MRRYREIDILRGFAIVLVILGHAIVVYPVNLMNVAWCKSAFSFVITLHMPIFFGIAGFCFHQNKSYTYMVKKKFARLLIPYIVFNLMDMFCRLAFSELVNRPSSVRDSIYKILFHGGEYWFLYVLFLICIIWGTVQAYIKKYAWLQIVVGIGAVGINLLNISFDLFRVDSICKYFVFFYVGFLIQIYWDRLVYMKKILKNVGIICLMSIIWIGIFVIWYQNGEKIIPEILISFIGIFVCLMLAGKICNTRLGVALADVGKYSLQLYLVNGYFLGVSRIVLVQLLGCSSSVLIVVGNLVFDLLGAFCVIKHLMMKIPVVRFLCGEI